MQGMTASVCQKNLFLDRLTKFKNGAKTSKMSSSAYLGTVEIILRSKSKSLAPQGFSSRLEQGSLGFPEAKKHESGKSPKIFFLTVCHFFDTPVRSCKA